MVYQPKGRTEGVSNRGAEENIWAYTTESNRRMEKNE
jgi:hypothetical protein